MILKPRHELKKGGVVFEIKFQKKNHINKTEIRENLRLTDDAVVAVKLQYKLLSGDMMFLSFTQYRAQI